MKTEQMKTEEMKTEQKKKEEKKKEHTTTEQMKTEEKKKEHTTTQQTADADGANAADAKKVVVGVFSKSFETENENRNQKPRREIFNEADSAVSGKPAHLSRFTLEDCLKYAKQSDGVKNPNALASSLYQTGNADAFIMAMLYPADALAAERETFGAPVEFTNEPCRVCFGAKMADTDGRGYRKCEHCRDERGAATGLEPGGVSGEQ